MAIDKYMGFMSVRSAGIMGGAGDSLELWEEIVNGVPKEVLVRPNVKILNVACGLGVEAKILAKRMMNLGVSLDKVRESIWVLDKESVFVDEVQKLSGFTNCITADFIEWKTDMKFDIVIGNPPFQETKKSGDRKDQASNLWSKFWVKSLELTKNDGVTALITPTTWTSPCADLKGPMKINGKARLWDVFDSYDSYANVTDVAQHFNGVGSTFGYVIVNKAKTTGLKFSDGAKTTLGFRPKSGFDRVETVLDLVDNFESRFKVNQNNSNDLRVSVPLTRVLEDSSVEILDGEDTPTTGHKDPAMYLYVHVPDMKTAHKVKDRLIGSLDVLKTHCRFSGFLNIKIVKMLKI